MIYSVGGGALANEETAKNPPANIYPMTHISEILEWCNREGQTFWEYVEECEGPEFGIISMRSGPPCAKPSCGV